MNIYIYLLCGLVIAGQSYEIRMLDNRKIGELPEITGKMVKVRKSLKIYLHNPAAASVNLYKYYWKSSSQQLILHQAMLHKIPGGCE